MARRDGTEAEDGTAQAVKLQSLAKKIYPNLDWEIRYNPGHLTYWVRVWTWVGFHPLGEMGEASLKLLRDTGDVEVLSLLAERLAQAIQEILVSSAPKTSSGPVRPVIDSHHSRMRAARRLGLTVENGER